jgi:hypothetical protein
MGSQIVSSDSKSAETNRGQVTQPSPSSSTSRGNHLPSSSISTETSKVMDINTLPSSVPPARPRVGGTARSENTRLQPSSIVDGEERTSTYHLSSFLDDDQDTRISTLSVEYPNSRGAPIGAINERLSLASRGSIASSDVLGSDRLTRASMSSYGGYDDEEPEPVVVARATAVKIARAPSVALQRNFDILTQANTLGAANLDDDQIASTHWRAVCLIQFHRRGVITH